MNFQQLQQFRQQAYQCLGLAKDATFELADAAPEYAPHLMFGRFSPQSLISASVVKQVAFQDCRPDQEQLMKLYIKQMLQVERPVLLIDHRAWLRPDAPTLKERI